MAVAGPLLITLATLPFRSTIGNAGVLLCVLLAVVAPFVAAGIEFAWYALATGINPWRVLAANETLRFGLRSAHYVALAGLAVVVLAGLRRITGMSRVRSRLAA